MTPGGTIAVCRSRPPFCSEAQPTVDEALVEALAAAGSQVDLVTLPFDVDDSSGAAAWAMVNLGDVGGAVVDTVVCLDLASLFVRHGRRIAVLDARVVRSDASLVAAGVARASAVIALGEPAARHIGAATPGEIVRLTENASVDEIVLAVGGAIRGRAG